MAQPLAENGQSPMKAIWPIDDTAVWRAALEEYADVVAALGVSRLVVLDDWYQFDFPDMLKSRSPKFVTLDELIKVTEWKMKRGVYRAHNLQLIKGNPAEDVKQRSEKAFSLIPDPRKPIAELAALAGVGPATASAVLAAARPDLYPFFDEIVANQIPGLGPVAFTIPYYIKYAERLRERAKQLGKTFTPHAVAQALFSAAGGKAGV